VDNPEKILAFLKNSAPIAGGAVGGAIGFVTGGPAGAALGGALGAALTHGVEEAAQRALSHREKIRVGAAASYAIDFIRERVEHGDKPRDDKFFENFEDGPSMAEEIFDGVLQKAKGDHEERKARFYGKFDSNVAFDVSCSRSEANYVLNVLERLTYGQLVILSLFAEPSRFAQLPADSYENKKIDPELSNTLLATFELSQIGLIKLWVDGKEGDAEALLDMGDIRPKHLGLSISGKRLFELAGLDLIPSKELAELAGVFASSAANAAALIEVSKLRGR